MKKRDGQALIKKLDASNRNPASKKAVTLPVDTGKMALVTSSKASAPSSSLYREFIRQLYDLAPDLDAKLTSYFQQIQQETVKNITDVKLPNLVRAREEIARVIDSFRSLSKSISKLKAKNPDKLAQLNKLTKSSSHLMEHDIKQIGKIVSELTASLGLAKEEQEQLAKWLDAQRKLTLRSVIEQDLVSLPSDKVKTMQPKALTSIVLPKAKAPAADRDIKPLDQLLAEMVLEGDKKNLPLQYHKVQSYYDKWRKCELEAINGWALAKKGRLTNDTEEICELIAIMDRANELVSGGHRLRDTQVLSVLTFLQTNDKGMLCQIQTGEGKTTVVALLAVIQALQGSKVDIITSNNVLATEGATGKENFYSLFGLTVATNNPDTKEDNRSSDPRPCYTADIVYGSIGNFQFDCLRDIFLGYATRGGREFKESVVILDEVDSMLIDNGRHIAKLAAPFPGMENFRYIYIKIWQELQKHEHRLVGDKAVTTSDISSIKSSIKKMHGDSKLVDYQLIPKHLHDYVKKQLDGWIDNAIIARYSYQENVQYIIKNKDGEPAITPVDYLNTGVSLHNTVWPNGLHQFLQLKHNLPLTVETLTNAHISNMGYIKKYGSKILGMSGTLGSDSEKKLLATIYQVGCAKIPTYKAKNFSELPALIVKDKDWLDTTILSILTQIEQNRAVLVICDTIQNVRTIKEQLELYNSLEPGVNIMIYTDEDESDITAREIKPGDIIIATNIAGRGTDISTSEVLQQNGGLHVCVAFLPCNQRVEDQAFGRTARQGKVGTAQLIIKENELHDFGLSLGAPIELLKQRRNEAEAKRIKDVLAKAVELDWQDKLFSCFSELSKKLQQENANVAGFSYLLEDLKEFWAFWLDGHTIDTVMLSTIASGKGQKQQKLLKQKIEEQFAKFMEEVETLVTGKKPDAAGGKVDCAITERIIHNPYYAIKQAEYWLQQNDLGNNRLALAEAALRHAESLSDKGMASIYLKLFESHMDGSWRLFDHLNQLLSGVFELEKPSSIDKYQDYKKKAISFLKQAQESLAKEINYLTKLLRSDGDFKSILYTQSSLQSKETMPENPSLKAQLSYISKSFYLESVVTHTINDHNKLEGILKEQRFTSVLVYYQPATDLSPSSLYIIRDGNQLQINYYDPQGGKLPYKLKWVITKYCQQEGLVKEIMTISRAPALDIASQVSQESLLAKNLLVKHLYAKLACLKIQADNVVELTKTIDDNEDKDIIITVKSLHDLEKAAPQIITTASIVELDNIGLEHRYALSPINNNRQSKKQFRAEELAKSTIKDGLGLLNLSSEIEILGSIMKKIGSILFSEGLSFLVSAILQPNSNKEYIASKMIAKIPYILDQTSRMEVIIGKTIQAVVKNCQEMPVAVKYLPYTAYTSNYDIFLPPEQDSKHIEQNELDLHQVLVPLGVAEDIY